jgi:hypothetical protein
MSELATWDSFYVIVGSAAGALIGLQFVVVTLIAQRPMRAAPEASAAFGTPTIVSFRHRFAARSADPRPMAGDKPAGNPVGCDRIVRCDLQPQCHPAHAHQGVYEPEFEDWLFHVVLPMIAYAILSFRRSLHCRTRAKACSASAPRYCCCSSSASTTPGMRSSIMFFSAGAARKTINADHRPSAAPRRPIGTWAIKSSSGP